jgi:hypothetical protein
MPIRGHFVRIRYSHDELKIIHVLHRGSFIPPRDGPDALRCVVRGHAPAPADLRKHVQRGSDSPRVHPYAGI